MDILVTRTRHNTRRYRVNGVANSSEAVEKVQALKGDDTAEGITVLEDGQSDTDNCTTQPAPKRQAGLDS